MTITRHTFTVGIGVLLISYAVSGCTDPTTDSGSPAASSIGPSGVRELVTMDQPDFTGVNLDRISSDPTGIEATVATATMDPSRRWCLFPRKKGNAPTTMEPGSGDHNPAGFCPTVTSTPTTGDTIVKGAVLLYAGETFALCGDDSNCCPTAARLFAFGYHYFIADYRVRPHTQAEAGCNLARATQFVRARVADYSLSSAQHIALGGYSAGDIPRGGTILNRSGSASPTGLDVDYTPDALGTVSTDAAATVMIYPLYSRLSMVKLDPSRLTGAVPTCCCYGTRDPFYNQLETQAKALAGSGVTLRARVLNGWPHGFGAEDGWIEEYDAFLRQAFAST